MYGYRVQGVGPQGLGDGSPGARGRGAFRSAIGSGSSSRTREPWHQRHAGIPRATGLMGPPPRPVAWACPPLSARFLPN